MLFRACLIAVFAVALCVDDERLDVPVVAWEGPIDVQAESAPAVRILTERGIETHVSMTAAGEKPLTLEEARGLLRRNIRLLEQELTNTKHPTARAVLEAELRAEREALHDILRIMEIRRKA